jgi:hypothetical protein
LLRPSLVTPDDDHRSAHARHIEARTVLETESWVGGQCFLKDATNLWKRKEKERKETYLETSEASYHHDTEERGRSG